MFELYTQQSKHTKLNVRAILIYDRQQPKHTKVNVRAISIYDRQQSKHSELVKILKRCNKGSTGLIYFYF